MKIIAVMNDNTGVICDVLKGYEHEFLSWNIVDDISPISHFGEIGEDVLVKIKWGNFSKLVDSRKYSFIYEEEDE